MLILTAGKPIVFDDTKVSCPYCKADLMVQRCDLFVKPVREYRIAPEERVNVNNRECYAYYYCPTVGCNALLRLQVDTTLLAVLPTEVEWKQAQQPKPDEGLTSTFPPNERKRPWRNEGERPPRNEVYER